MYMFRQFAYLYDLDKGRDELVEDRLVYVYALYMSECPGEQIDKSRGGEGVRRK